MGHVAVGKTAANARRKSAYERLGDHLDEHKKFHKGMDEEAFKSHDRVQRAEYEHLGNILSGKVSKESRPKKIILEV